MTTKNREDTNREPAHSSPRDLYNMADKCDLIEIALAYRRDNADSEHAARVYNNLAKQASDFAHNPRLTADMVLDCHEQARARVSSRKMEADDD